MSLPPPRPTSTIRVAGYFDEADFDDSHSIGRKEFEKLMMSTGMYTPETMPDDVTEAQLKALEEEEEAKRNKAATKLQARQRGNAARRATADRRG